MSKLDLLSRSSELARLFGIQLSEVFSRGSQYRVESSMLRLAKPRNYIPVSPSRQQLLSQAAPEYLALLLEPESRMYTDPVIVLDFQSLYPSIMIAYNYCFTTCLGRLQNFGNPGAYQFGCTQLQISAARLNALKEWHELDVQWLPYLVFINQYQRWEWVSRKTLGSILEGEIRKPLFIFLGKNLNARPILSKLFWYRLQMTSYATLI